jgi:hypothetical protein
LAISVFLVGLAQEAPAAPKSPLLSGAQTESEEDKLSEEVNDPTAILTQIRLFDFYTPENLRSRAQTNIALIQPIIPLARLSLLPVEQIIRPTIKLSTTAIGSGRRTVTGLADIQLYDLFQSQWPHLEPWKLRWAIGTTAVFPTATDRRNGAGAWQMGSSRSDCLRGRAESVGRSFGTECHLICLYAQRCDTPKCNVVPAGILIPIGTWLVCEIDRLDLDNQLASQNTHHDSRESRVGENIATQWADD